ncbi:hypothetical protein [Bacillus sp. 6YEL31]|uniref:hypothetical protein n=1 Tax=Bacillus sp. 6YEL31 TaxID=2778091 RepID=UPI001C9A37C2|nr:hypothetical protein [Bacillus sp. 6YEL31]MBY7101167.1 hypothetical protein [Bacillus sp. 6YEL31]
MRKFSPLKYWLERKKEIPSFPFFNTVRPNFEYGFFLGLDICVPLHEVMNIPAQDLETSWHKTKEYVENALDILIYEYREEVSPLEDEFIDVDNDQIYYIKEELGEYPTHCYPIYLVTVGTGSDERLVYVGKTSSKKHRFLGGHKVALKLLNPKYDGLEKNIYFGCLVFIDEAKEYVPLEWIHPLEEAVNILKSVESGLIYYFSPELNTASVKRNYSKIPISLHIQNFSGESKFLHDEILQV